MPLAKIPSKVNNENDRNGPHISSPHKSPSQRENKLKQLLQSNNTIRQGRGLSSRTVVKPRRPLGQKDANTTNIISNKLTTSKHIKEKMQHKPKISSALPPSKLDHGDSDIFAHIDTPVHTLPIDCLITIFECLGDFENYCTLLGVCRRWRNIVNQPFLWKHVDFKWTTLCKQIDLLHRPRRHFEQLNYISKLTIRHKDKTVMRNPIVDFIEIAPFKMLRELHLIDMDLTDISFLISWLKNIKVLHCEKIHASRGKINLTAFSELDQLESLQLDCARPYPIDQPSFTPFRDSAENKHAKRLPKSLKRLSICNMYDSEEIVDISSDKSPLEYKEFISAQTPEMQQRICRFWLYCEDQLVLKYQMFASLNNLTSLTLGRVSAFTSRVWRECLIPCSKNLEYLSMSHWEGMGKRESPEKIIERLRTLDNDVYDVEVALSEFLSSLKNIKRIKLESFDCGDGVINGFAKIKRKYTLTWRDTPTNKHISDYRNMWPSDMLIHFVD